MAAQAPESSAEANMIRDEIRSALVGLDVATDRLVRVLAHAEEFVRGQRRPPRITRFETPATRPDESTAIRE